jgi:hypothetical protein
MQLEKSRIIKFSLIYKFLLTSSSDINYRNRLSLSISNSNNVYFSEIKRKKEIGFRINQARPLRKSCGALGGPVLLWIRGERSMGKIE